MTWICEYSEEEGRKSGPGSGGLLQGKEGVAFTWGEIWFLRSDILLRWGAGRKELDWVQMIRVVTQ